MKNKYLMLFMGVALPTIIGLSACNGGSTTTNNYISGCDLPTFTPQIGQNLLNNWGKQVQYWSTKGSNESDIYINAGYFTMTNYAPDTILLPTVSSIQRNGTDEIYDYFTHFLAKHPVMTLPNTESNAFKTMSCGFGTGSGYYNFDLTDPTTGVHSTVAARFTFVYKYESKPFTEIFHVESGSTNRESITQTNMPGWYIWTQNSAVLPSN